MLSINLKSKIIIQISTKMPIKFLPNDWKSSLELMRFYTPTGYLLTFFPAAFGLLLAYEQTNHLLYLLIFFVGSIFARSAGCIINDFFDQKLDIQVERTKNRPLASKKVTNTQALGLLSILLCLCLAILLCLSITAIITGFIAFFLIMLYPFMKRVTYFPQVFLGITFNLGCIIGYSTVKDNISANAFILYIACGFWTIAYDTIYAFGDIKDDKKIGIKSTAIFFENKPYKLIITSFYTTFFILFAFATKDFLSYFFLVIMAVCFLYSLWLIISLNINDPRGCLFCFKANRYIGFLLIFGMLLEKL